MSDTDARIAALLKTSPVFDGHNDLAWALRERGYDLVANDITSSQPQFHTDLPRLRAGGVGAQFWSVYVPGTTTGGQAVSDTLEQIDCVQRFIAANPDTLQAARTAADVQAAWAQGKIASLLGAEGGHSINSSLPVLRVLRRLGVAYLTLTHNQNVPWADSATDAPNVNGLNDFGREVVAEMNRIGMLVDLSHVAVTTMRDAIAASAAPVIFSHSGCRAVCDHVRNAPDEVLTALRANNGIIMLTFVPRFVSAACAEHAVALEAEHERLGIRAEDASEPDAAALADLQAWQEKHPAPRATVADVADHVEHAREVVGPKHLGLGGDYDGVPALPVGLPDVSSYPVLLAELANRGWSDADLAGLTSGNILRVMTQAEQVAEW